MRCESILIHKDFVRLFKFINEKLPKLGVFKIVLENKFMFEQGNKIKFKKSAIVN